jgi:hypothetical protein
VKHLLKACVAAALLLASFHGGRLYQTALSRAEILNSVTKSTIRIQSLKVSIHAPKGMLLTYKED